MKKKFIPFSPPLIGSEEIEEVRETLQSDWITTGPKTKRFEEEFAQYTGAAEALALSSCTAGLHLALLALGIKPGDSVITTPMTFCAGVNVIEHLGATPVLVDVEPDTLNIDPAKIVQAIDASSKREKPKALIAVHYAGHPCDMDPILDLAKCYKIKIVEDAAHALPAKYKGRFVGTIGDLTSFSFYATKNLTTAEGGMLTGNPELLKKAKMFALHGMDHDAWKRYDKTGSWKYDVVYPGFKYNMPDVLAAIGLAQLKKLSGFHVRRKEIAGLYNAAFAPIEALQTPASRQGIEPALHLYPLRLNLEKLGIGRDVFIEEMNERGIGTSVHFIPVHTFTYYKEKYGFKPGDFPVAYREYQRLISLPIYPRMTNEDVESVIEAVTEIVKKQKNE